ncbi:hypothetical protein AURDEDRAFT_172691 [Auricularia subglabra TFB-10046 SS5]|nr:hypothetical protein AURDEDRAFT_172691 [Auricularia subglabra TFB-10046 SS5]
MSSSSPSSTAHAAVETGRGAEGPAAIAQLTVPASLYFITLASALSLVIFISSVMIGRMALIRARERRLQRAGLAPASSKGYEPAPPRMHEVWLRDAGTRCSGRWAGILPVSASPQPVSPSTGRRASTALRPPNFLERVLRLPPLPIPAERLDVERGEGVGSGKLTVAVLVAMPRPRRDVFGDVVLGTAAPVRRTLP